MDPVVIHKTFAAKATASADPDKPGQFVALVSAFGNKDSQGDIVEEGAFTKTLAEWVIKGRPIPVVWAHQFGDMFKILGKYTAAEETSEGLKMTGQLNLKWAEAQRVYDLMQEELVVEFSISGKVRDYEFIEDDEDEDSWWPSMKIKDIDLWEAGPCFKGANSETELLSVKSDGHLQGRAIGVRKEGRILATKYVDKLKTARDDLDAIIQEVDKPEQEQKTAKNAAADVTLTEKGAEVTPDNPRLTPAVRAALAFLQ